MRLALLAILFLMVPWSGCASDSTMSGRCAMRRLDVNDQVVVEIVTALERRTYGNGHSIFSGRINEGTDRGPEIPLEFSPDACAAVPLPGPGLYRIEADTGGSQAQIWSGTVQFDYVSGAMYVQVHVNETNRYLG